MRCLKFNLFLPPNGEGKKGNHKEGTMAETQGKRAREAKKRQQKEVKTERKRLRKEGLLGQDTSGLFLPGEPQRQVTNS